MKHLKLLAASILGMAALASTPAWGGLITLDLTYSGPITGTGLYVYDDVSDSINEWSWSFDGISPTGDGFFNGVPTGGGGASIADLLLGNVVSSVVLPFSAITGFPGDDGRDFQHSSDGTFFMGDVSSGRGLSGEYSAVARAVGVPEPGTLALLGAGLIGLGLMRRKRAA